MNTESSHQASAPENPADNVPPVTPAIPDCAFDTGPWPEPVPGAVLLDQLRETLNRFIILPKWGAETLALWIPHTYAFHLRDVSTYIGIESPQKRCGKTTLINFLRQLVRRPEVAANISSPAFFRVIEQHRPTLLMDEADTLLLGNDELRGILNSGYTRDTAYVVRVINKPPSDPAPSSGPGRPSSQHSRPAYPIAHFSCWCPKLIAGIGRLPDTLADRCIVIRMHRKTPLEKCERLRLLTPLPLKQKCARFVLDHAAEIAAAKPALPAGLNDRAADIWEPLFALADIAGAHWPETARNAAVGLTLNADENNPISALLLDIFLLFAADNREKMFSRELVLGLSASPDRPWAALRRGKAITELWLAHQLRPYDVRPRSIWIDDIPGKGYFFEDFHDAFRRYISRTEYEALRESLLAAPQPSAATIAKLTQPDAVQSPVAH